ncbi:MAG: hypothetical protein AAF670_16220 [Planctomycetota bacterium]
MYAAETEIEFTYPESTQVESRTTYRKRRVRVRAVRDLFKDPLTPDEYFRRPLTHRSRYLLTGFDLDASQWRRFYLGSSREHAGDGRLRVALYREGGDQPVRVITRPFEPTRRDRIALARTLRQMLDADHQGLQLRVIPDNDSVKSRGPHAPF